MNRFGDLEEAQTSVKAKATQAGGKWIFYPEPPHGMIQFAGLDSDGISKLEVREYKFCQNDDQSWSVIEGERVGSLPSH